ncbi:MAG: PorT family protein [Candidatus Fibromonas sp.]|jgi:predicted Fe-Mo cluster-binding NifX family protein|nr:PorT family protein [Candidatus Fibromonas sp.]
MAENELRRHKIKAELFLFLFCFAISAFAQDRPEKAAVYVSGAGEAGINKSFGNKLLFAITQSGKYAEIGNAEAFHSELSKSPHADASQIAQAAKQHGADIVCVVGLTEVLGAYSISARLIRTSDLQVLKTALVDRSLKSLDDLTAASDELAARLLDLPLPPSTSPAAPASSPVAPPQTPVAAAAQKECKSKFNLNELVSKISSGFPSQLKDCSAALAKNMALAASPFGKKTEMKEPKAFMVECTIDGIKHKLPAGAVEYIKPVESFLQIILNAASSGGSLDVKKLSGAIGSMNINDLINELKTKAANDECASDEPYEPPDEPESEEEDSEAKKGRKFASFGLRAGINFSHLYADYYGYYGDESGTYGSTLGLQFGLLLDLAPASWFHLQHGIMYIQKGTSDENITSHYIELLPVSLSFKFAAFRIGAGPYFGFCVAAPYDYIDSEIDIGINAVLGFDIGMFYIGTFYDYGLVNVSNRRNFDFYNRTLGFNLGINL